MTEIFYYSGTGFTIKAAKLMKKALDGEVKLTPVVGAMKNGRVESRAKKVGLLFPMHAFALPVVCCKFLKELQLPNAEYIFALVTRGGGPSKMHKEIGRYLRRKNKTLSAFKYATTDNTFQIIYPVHLDEVVEDAKTHFEDDIRALADTVNRGENKIDQGYRNWAVENLLGPMLKRMNRLTGYFKLQHALCADGRCTGCGKCAQMCPSGKIAMQNGKPMWQKTVQCQYCLACLHRCPQVAVQVSGSKTPRLQRIYPQGVGWEEIAAQKALD